MQAKLVYFITEDWFFASHFLPMGRQASGMALAPMLVARVQNHRRAIEATGIRLEPLEFDRRQNGPLYLISIIARLRQILRRERPKIIHCIGMKSILIGGVASAIVGIPGRIFAVTGLGYLGARQDVRARLTRAMLGLLMRRILANANTIFLMENVDDAKILGIDVASDRVVVIGGAGVDPEAFPALPLPEDDTLRIAVVSRMLWSKGIDVAVAAVKLARSRGVAVKLALYGTPDPQNPRFIPLDTLEEWAEDPAITYHGQTSDIRSVWSTSHVACLPSRGGEGLPRTLLESAASGRLSLTTDVPGCRNFVRHGIDGYVLPVDDVEAFARVIEALAADREAVRQMGEAAAQRVRNGFTERDVMNDVGKIYDVLLENVQKGKKSY
ncbi:glycosyltransferase family 4 protein [Consotaella salsifontis]|uniref:Glycosyltransferase involved in cell wall bisynthesis n=1 Tax=Consotaella salsifontis TaxID=1365950 RepID=A0A1T4P1Y8_9HYPH|nr:glycosyltransferase family 4 protein [Consotaella salsifontis]SJZ85630.1 Glycosyltransferase involved in cell wall bisynthesis [Consotaella salsifontis]